MSTNYTKNYNLCQWEASDRVLREDFNADNAKLDAALKGVQTTAEAARAQAQAITAAAYTKTDYTPVVTGTYSGDGQSVRTIELGFRPKAVFVCPANGSILSYGVYNSSDIVVYGGLAIDQRSCGGAITVTDTGFQVIERSPYRRTNISGLTYSYIAFR